MTDNNSLKIKTTYSSRRLDGSATVEAAAHGNAALVTLVAIVAILVSAFVAWLILAP